MRSRDRLERLIVVAYDVRDDARRARLARVLEDYGVRTQLSVFECSLAMPEFLSLLRATEQLIDSRADRIAYYRVCERCSPRQGA